MKLIIPFLLLIGRVYAGIKILIWLVQQNWSSNHPISEISTILVYVLFDIWICTINNQINSETED